MVIMQFSINILALLLSVVAYMGIGMLWYSPQLFGSIWAESLGLNMAEIQKKSMVLPIIGGFCIATVIAFFLQQVFAVAGITTMVSALRMVVYLTFGFIVPTQFSGVLWAGTPIKAFIINNGAFLVSLLAMAAITVLLK